MDVRLGGGDAYDGGDSSEESLGIISARVIDFRLPIEDFRVRTSLP